MDQTAHCSTTIYTCQPVHIHSSHPHSQRSDQGRDIRSTTPRPVLKRIMASLIPWFNLQYAPQRISNWEPGSTYFQRGRLVRRAGPGSQPRARVPSAYMRGHFHSPEYGWSDYHDLPPPSTQRPRDPLRQHAANIRRLERELRQVRGEPEEPRRRRRVRSHGPALSSSIPSSSSSSSSSTSSSASTSSSGSSPHPRFTCPCTERGEPRHVHRQQPSPYPWHRPYVNEDCAYDYGLGPGYGPGVSSHGGFGQSRTRPRRVTFSIGQPRWQDFPHFDPHRGQGLVREPRWRGRDSQDFERLRD